MVNAMTVGITMSNKTRPEGLKITGSFIVMPPKIHVLWKKSDKWMQKAEKLPQVTFFFGSIHCMSVKEDKSNPNISLCTWINEFSFNSCLFISTLNRQNNRKQTPLLCNCCVCPSFGLLRWVKMCYCTRVFWPRVQPHCSCREQNGELSDCWQTAAVTGCCFLTHGWHRAPTGGPFEHHPELWCGRINVAILTRFHFWLVLPAARGKGGRGRPVHVDVSPTGPPQTAWGSSWPLLTLWYKTDPYRPGGKVLCSKWGFCCDGWREEMSASPDRCGNGAGEEVVIFPSRDRLPVSVTAHQAQFLCAGETSTWQTDVMLELSGLSFRLCAATYTHISS